MKKVIITGVSSGLGFELAKTFLEKGYEVIGLSRTKPTLNIIHIKTDLTNDENIEKVSNIINEKYSDFSCVILCAGIGYIEKLDTINQKHADETFKINISGQNYLLSKISNSIKTNNADLIFIGATIGYKGNEFMPFYSITKWGTRGMIENWRNELKSTKSRVIGVHPGGLNTESNIGENGRETKISKITGKDISSLIDVTQLSNLILNFFELPKNIEISEIIVNRK